MGKGGERLHQYATGQIRKLSNIDHIWGNGCSVVAVHCRPNPEEGCSFRRTWLCTGKPFVSYGGEGGILVPLLLLSACDPSHFGDNRQHFSRLQAISIVDWCFYSFSYPLQFGRKWYQQYKSALRSESSLLRGRRRESKRHSGFPAYSNHRNPAPRRGTESFAEGLRNR